MSGIFKETKAKIIISYLLLFLLSFIAVVFIYKQVTRLTVSESGVSNANQKLFIIGNTITGLYEAESLSNAFLQTGSNRSFKKYIDLMAEVETNIDSLRSMTHQPNQQTRLDSISMLLTQKTKNLQSLIKARKSLSKDEFYDKAIASIESNKDTIEETPDIRSKIITTQDSSYVTKETARKKFLKWLGFKPKKDSVLQVTVSQAIIVDTVNKVPLRQSTDTVINILRSVWEDVQEKRKNIVHQINRTEYNIITQSTHITDQLRRILSEYEKEEINNSFRKIEDREQLVNATTNVIAWIAPIAVCVILFFSFFILRDISRSQRYRRKLEAANLYAEQLLNSREKLILTVTHDIKSPLGSIIGYIELLNNTDMTNRQGYFLKNMKSSSEHILKLVTNLLDLSKLESNKMPLEEVAFNPSHLFQEVCDSFLPMAQMKNLRLTCHVGKNLDRDCKGDVLRIRQILSNLLSNAVKYTNKGTIGFHAEISPSAKEVVIQIKDSGPGMTQEEQQLIFKEFTRLSSSSTIEGTGLGLTITLKLVELLGGEITLDSIPGEGSCFTIVLPLKWEIQGEKHPSAVVEMAPAQTIPAIPESLKKLRILLVDDDPLQLEMTKALLQSRGIEADTTTEPGKAIGLLREKNYDVVFSDIQMPGIDGFALVKLIRNSDLPCAGSIPVVALSANPDKTEKEYQACGFTAYLNKPFAPPQLFGILETITGTSGTEQKEDRQQVANAAKEDGYTLKNIMQFADNDPEATKKIMESFIRDTLHHLDLLKEYADTGQAEAVYHLAHKMLPLFRQLETGEIVELLQQLEQTNIPATEVSVFVEKITALCQELIEKLRHSME